MHGLADVISIRSYLLVVRTGRDEEQQKVPWPIDGNGEALERMRTRVLSTALHADLLGPCSPCTVIFCGCTKYVIGPGAFMVATVIFSPELRRDGTMTKRS